VAIGDIGLMALSASGAALVENMPEIEVLEILDDHIVLTDVKTELQVGDTFTVIPSYQDMLIDRWDHYVAIRDGVVEEIWDIPGRGCSQ
jgi:D-serine deaminase-like pyridoxal phosphate-dependent protein